MQSPEEFTKRLGTKQYRFLIYENQPILQVNKKIDSKHKKILVDEKEGWAS